MKARVFQASSPPGVHLGNYLGAIKQWVQAQDNYENIFCIVNSHAITIPKDPKELHRQSLEMATLLLACGIDPQKSSLFIQSQIDEHGALAWLLNCVASMGELNRMTQFKDKSAKQGQVSAGLFAYPVLMADRHFALPNQRRARGRRPKATFRTGTQFSPKVQPRLWQVLCGA